MNRVSIAKHKHTELEPVEVSEDETITEYPQDTRLVNTELSQLHNDTNTCINWQIKQDTNISDSTGLNDKKAFSFLMFF